MWVIGECGVEKNVTRISRVDVLGFINQIFIFRNPKSDFEISKLTCPNVNQGARWNRDAP